MRYFLLLPKMRIHNANAQSSPYTIGFPAMTAWLGAVHALQRKLQLQDAFAKLTLPKVAVSCHRLDVQTYRGANDFVSSIIGTGNPLDKNGERPSFIEEARCHLEVSLLIELGHWHPDYQLELPDAVLQCLPTMKMAGGDVMPNRTVTKEDNCHFKRPEIIIFDDDNQYQEGMRVMAQKLMLGHVLRERRGYLQQYQIEHPEEDALGALLAHVQIQHRPVKDANGDVVMDKDKVKWEASRLRAGWLVPIAVGFQGISALGQAQNQRDATTPHRFAESVVTLGEFVMPHRIQNVDEMLWQYHVDSENDLYVCQTAFAEFND